MSSDRVSRRQAISYVGAGAIAGSTAVYGLGTYFTQDATAQVHMSFEDATVELPEDNTIDDLRITGDIGGEFDTGGTPSELVQVKLDVEMEQFGGFDDSKDYEPGESSGTVDWSPTYSLIEQTEMTGDTDLQSASYDNNTRSFNVTTGVEMDVFADGYLNAEAKDGATGTITFVDPTEDQSTDDGTETESSSPYNGDASVSVAFSFEVDK